METDTDAARIPAFVFFESKIHRIFFFSLSRYTLYKMHFFCSLSTSLQRIFDAILSPASVIGSQGFPVYIILYNIDLHKNDCCYSAYKWKKINRRRAVVYSLYTYILTACIIYVCAAKNNKSLMFFKRIIVCIILVTRNRFNLTYPLSAYCACRAYHKKYIYYYVVVPFAWICCILHERYYLLYYTIRSEKKKKSVFENSSSIRRYASS